MKDLILDIFARFSSRKFLIAVVGCLVVFGVNLSGEQIAAITALIVAYTASEGASDAIRAYNE